MHADEGCYVKPGTDAFMASPADETAQPPGEAMVHADAVEQGVQRVREMTTLDPGTLRATWAGLRTFAPDRGPVLGPHPDVPGFAWYAGLGGWGIMTAPAAARSVVSLIDQGELPDDVAAFGLTPADVLPDRLLHGDRA
jgi:D-arginine dehydrogenase